MNFGRLRKPYLVLIFMLVSVADLHVTWAESGDSSARTCEAATAPVPVAVTLSGGVSLGAYQAGSLYYSSLVFKDNPTLFQPRLLTGASAGALNALFAVLSICGEEKRRPSESAFYQTWVGFKGQELLAGKGENESLFSRDAFQGIASSLEAQWKRGLPLSCDVVLGLSVTRLHALTDLSKIGFARQGEKVTLRIRGRGLGRAPLLTNYVNPTLFPKPLLLDLDVENDAQNFEALKQVLFASSAFPIAFAPQKLRTCVAKNTEEWSHGDLPFRCPKDDVEEAKFIDGGILDNKPLALAEKISRTGLTIDACGATRWREIPSGDTGAGSLPGSELLYFYSDLSATTYVKPKPASDSAAFTIAPMLLGNVFNSSRNQDSSSLLEQSPSLENQIAAPKNGIPRMGDSLFGFFGFFERDFRAFDFYVGLWEAREYFESSLRPKLRQGAELIGAKIKLPGFDPPSMDAKKLECLDATFKSWPDAEAVCAKVDDRGFVILARLAVERLRQNRTDFSFMVQRLADEGYKYRDLGLSANEAWRAPAKIKTETIRAVSNLASAQPLTEGFALSAVGPLVLNLVEPLPIERDFSFLVGPQVQLATSFLMTANESSRWRLNFGVGLENTEAWLGPNGGRGVATPYTGFEYEPMSLNTSFLQTRFSLGGGYKFAANDERGAVTRVGVSLTLIERLKFQTDFEAMPFRERGTRSWQFLPSLGLQFYF